MDTVEPIITDAFRLLRADLYAHLDEAEALATKTDEWSVQDADAAHELISDLLVVVRGCLPVRDPQAPYLLLSVPNGDHEADETAPPAPPRSGPTPRPQQAVGRPPLWCPLQLLRTVGRVGARHRNPAALHGMRRRAQHRSYLQRRRTHSGHDARSTG